MVLFSVVTTTHREVEWVTRAMGRVFPAQWARFHQVAGGGDGDLAAAYARMLASADPQVREFAAREWCAWEDTHVATHPGFKPDARYDDPEFRMVFARLVTHYWANTAWLGPDQLREGVAKLVGIPAVLVSGVLDISGPADIAWDLAQRWPDAQLILVDDAGHGSGGMRAQLLAALNRFAEDRRGRKHRLALVEGRASDKASSVGGDSARLPYPRQTWERCPILPL